MKCQCGGSFTPAVATYRLHVKTPKHRVFSEWLQQRDARRERPATGWLHAIRCHNDPCVCQPIPVYDPRMVTE